MARKRDERAVRAAQKKERQAQSYLADDPNFVNFAQQLGSIGLKLRDIPGDGNCLFRALGDQLDGNGKNHHKHREDVVDYMLKHREDFEPFIEDDIPFQRYLENLRKVGTYAGNDAIVAFARLHKLTVVIHQFNSPLWQIHGSEDKNAKQIHISYHNGDHYSSVRKTSDLTTNPTSIKLKADGTVENGSNSTSSVSSSVSSKSSKKGHYYNTTNSSTSSSLVSPVASKYNVYQTSSDTFTWLPQNQQDSEGMFLNADLECNDDGNVVVTGDEYYQTGGYENEAGVARAIRDEDSLVEQISHETGCQDLQLIRESLQENFMDIGATVALITQVMFSMHGSEDHSLWTANGTGTRIFGNSQTGTKPKQQQTAKATKQQKKLEKKSRATERHKQRLLGGHTDSGYHGSKDSSEDDTVIVKNMAALNI